MNRQVNQFHNLDTRALNPIPSYHIHDTESLPRQVILFATPATLALGSCDDHSAHS